MTSNSPIITLQYSSSLKFLSLGLFILGIGIHDYTEMYRQVIGLLFFLLSIALFLFSKRNYKLYADKIIRKTYRTSITIPINVTTLCYEYSPETTKKGSDKPANVFFIEAKAPKQRFKIYETSWTNYSEFKKEVEKAIKNKVNAEARWQKKMSSKQKKIFRETFEERVSIAKEEMILEGKNTSQNITIGIGAVTSLIGVLGLLRIIILQLNFIETIAAEPFLIVIGLLVMAYAMFIEDYD